MAADAAGIRQSPGSVEPKFSRAQSGIEIRKEKYSEARGTTGSFHDVWRLYDKNTGAKLSNIDYSSERAAGWAADDIVSRREDQNPPAFSRAPGDVAIDDIRSPDTWLDRIKGKAADALKGGATFGALDRSIHTQLHKAARNPYFGEVFKRISSMMNDSSRAALRPSEAAPTVLPKIDAAESLGPALKSFLYGKQASADIDAAFQSVLRGTLDQRIYATAEAAELTPEQFRIYHEFRDAINASLEELASGEAFAVSRDYVDASTKKSMLDNPWNAQQIIKDTLQEKISGLMLKLNTSYDQAKTLFPKLGENPQPIKLRDKNSAEQNRVATEVNGLVKQIAQVNEAKARVDSIY